MAATVEVALIRESGRNSGRFQPLWPEIARRLKELTHSPLKCSRHTRWNALTRRLGTPSAGVRNYRRGMFNNETMFTNGQISHSMNNGVLVQAPFSGYLAAVRDLVLTFVGSAASSYRSGFFERGEDLHAQAEFAYTRMVQRLLRFRPQSKEAAENTDQCLKRTRTALDQLWSLHRPGSIQPH